MSESESKHSTTGELQEAVSQEVTERKFLSPTLNLLEEADLPQGASACKFCPCAIWMKSPDILECYCRVTMQPAWSSNEPTDVQLCDGMFLVESKKK